MPNFSLVIEYLLGGTQLFTIYLLNTVLIQNTGINLEPGLIILVIISFTYPAGIIADNLASFLFNKFQKEPMNHSKQFINLLKRSEPALVKRALGFESTKRLIRINCINSLLGILWTLNNLSNEINVSALTGLIIVLFGLLVASIFTYIRINITYQKYLTDISDIQIH